MRARFIPAEGVLAPRLAPADHRNRKGKKCQPACKPGFVWRGIAAARDGHSSGTPVAGRLAQPTRAAGLERTGSLAEPAPPLFGFAPGGVYRAASVAGRAVGSYPTLSPLPRPQPRRFAFCGTFPGVAPAGRYPAPFFRGARTFLPCGVSALAGAAVQPADARLVCAAGPSVKRDASRPLPMRPPPPRRRPAPPRPAPRQSRRRGLTGCRRSRRVRAPRRRSRGR